MQANGWNRLAVVRLAVLFEGGLAVLALVLGWLIGQSPLASFGWNARDLLLGVAASLPMLLGFAVCVRWPVGPLRRIKSFSLDVIRPLFRSCTLADLALVALLAGVSEEMLFRGVVQAALGRWIGICAGLVFSNIIFGLVHPITLAYIILAFLLGLYLGWVWLWSGNLLVVIVAHGLYDFFALWILVRGPIGSD